MCPNGERLTDAQKRMVEAITLIGERHAGERIAAVTHAVMIRLVAATILDRPAIAGVSRSVADRSRGSRWKPARSDSWACPRATTSTDLPSAYDLRSDAWPFEDGDFPPARATVVTIGRSSLTLPRPRTEDLT